MKKLILFILLAAVFFFIGYSQKMQTMEKKISIEALDEIVLKTGGASIIMKKDGTIQINGKDITVKGTGEVIMKGKKILDN